VEATALAAHPALGHGDAAAFDQGGSAALVAEVRPGAVAEARGIAAAVRAAVAAAHGLALDPVAFVPVGALPRTSSGKLQRARTAAALAEGSLATLAVERRGRA
jgi:acyl-CoA synthetase (AMP-forming)/AMP-acid ligase II